MAILITGANRGIGRALFDHYRGTGAEVWGTARGEFPDTSGRWVELDVTDPASMSGLGRRVDCVPINLLICNAGVYLDKKMKLADGFSAETWAKTFAVNVTGVFLTVQSLLPNLQMADAAKVAILSSAMGSSERARGGSYAYRASKAAATNLGRNLATDLEPLGIAVGIYHPGWVSTEMGGPDADLDMASSVEGLVARFAELDLSRTGVFCDYEGRPLAF